MDCIVIGKGPAGLQAAIYAVRAGLQVAVIGRDGGELARTDKIENYYGFAEPISGPELLGAGEAQARRLGVQLIDAEVTGAGWGEEGLFVRYGEETVATTALIVATGMPRRKAAVPGIEAFEGNGVSYCAVCDAFFYRGKAVAVIGAGAYAAQEARELLPFASQVTILSNGRPFSGQQDEKVSLDERKISEVVSGPEGLVAGVRFTDGETLPVDGLFVAEGTASALDFAVKLGLETNGNAVKIDPQGVTNLPGIFACGDCTGGLLQIAKAVGQGAEAGMSAAQYVKSLRGEVHEAIQWH